MSQNLLIISQEDFERELKRLSSSMLMTLLRNIYEWKWNNGKNVPMASIVDIERKETKINAELLRRGYLKQKDYKDYFPFLNKMNFKKRVF